MAITISQGSDISGSVGRNPTVVQQWYVEGTNDLAAAKAALVAGTPDVFDGLLRNNVQLQDMGDIDDTALTGSWDCTMTYGIIEIPELGQVRFSASTKGGRETITQAIDTFDSVALNGYEPEDTYGAIGLKEDGSVSGVGVAVPKSVFSLEVHLDYFAITDRYWSMLEAMTGTVNNARFKGRKPHDLMFLGADFDGTLRMGSDEQELARIRYDFQAESSRLRSDNNGVEIPGFTRPIDKRGFDHLEIRYGEFFDDTSKTKVRRPIMAWARQVSPASSFARMGIGT